MSRTGKTILSSQPRQRRDLLLRHRAALEASLHVKPLQAALSIWPKPRIVSQGETSATVSPLLSFSGDVSDPHVSKAVERYKELIFPHKEVVASGNDIKTVIVKLTQGEGEGYTLSVTPGENIKIEANEPVGVQYALETLSQLVSFDFDKSQYVTQAVLPLTVKDFPRFPHRGLLVDSSRHFLSVPFFKRVIRSISYAKLNRLHWHITDAQSFPIASRAQPSLASKGAFSSRERYSLGDVHEIVTYAKEHGIVVVPEFDMPGHTKSWGNARPDLMTGTVDKHNDGNSAALNPEKEETYKLVQALLTDWMVGKNNESAFFDSPLVHLGTDETPFAAWQKLGDVGNLFKQFVQRITNTAQGMGKEVVLWEEAMQKGEPSPKVIIQVWLNRNLARKAAQTGHRVLLSQGWYLDHLDKTWEDMYQEEPTSAVGSDQKDKLIGGEGCMWGETVDGGDLEQTTWPRLGAVAERLWSDESVRNVTEAMPRLSSFRCLLLERGIAAGTLAKGRDAPQGPGSCLAQF